MNTDVFTGADGSILLSTPGSSEGQIAQSILDANELQVVGRVQGIRVEVHAEVRAYHEVGQRYATQLRPGNVSVTGTIGRAYVNGALLSLLLGEAATGRPAGNWVQPAFNITVRVANPTNNAVNTLTLHDVKLDKWSYNLPEDEFVMEDLHFQALFITVAEE
jgi:hypothetical protein